MVSSSVFSGLTRKHGIKTGTSSLCSVKEVALAVGEIIGHCSVKSAACMNMRWLCSSKRWDRSTD